MLRAGSVLLLVLALTACNRGASERTRLILAATTSIEDTGLLEALTSEFSNAHPEIELSPVAVGTGQALELGRRGDADVLLTHDSVAEMELVAAGIASERRSVMYNDFIIAGPLADPAHARGDAALESLRAIAASRSPFVSRGDDSGTHRRERELWIAAGIKPNGGHWYREAGVGMGDALSLASQKQAYILTDRATYVRFRPRLDLAIITENDPPVFNHYGVTVMKGKRQEHGELFAAWITSATTQQLIGDFGRATFGQSLFTPSAGAAAGER